LSKILYINRLKAAIAGLARTSARFHLLMRLGDFAIAIPANKRRRRDCASAHARNFTQSIYQRKTLIAGDVFFDEVGVLQAGEFDSEAVFDMTDNAARGLADSDRGADRRPQLGRDRDCRA
jgi:hypothetical protein